MDLISMELPKKEDKANDASVLEGCPQEKFPWGLRLNFESEQVKLLPVLKEVEPGGKVIIMAEASVTDFRMSERRNGEKECSVGVQLEKVTVEPKVDKKVKDMTLKEYTLLRKAGMGDSNSSKELII